MSSAIGAVFGILILIFSSISQSQVSEKKISEWQEKINKTLSRSKISKSEMSLYISSDPTGKQPIFSLNESKKVIPASVTKIATSAMVLDQLPPGTKFKTQILSAGKIKGDTLVGDIFLKGGGDPSFVSENMWVLVNNFLRTRIKSIDGDIVVDDSLFDQSRFDSSRQEQRVDRAYDAPTGAMSFNWNSVNVYIRPADKVGEAATVIADPENEYIQLHADVQTVAAGTANSLAVDRSSSTNSEGDAITVKGKISIGSKEITVYKNITRPDIWSGYNLRSFLKQRGIIVKGKIRNGITNEKSLLLAEVESKPVELILSDMNKFSNNYVAEMLAKNAAALTLKPGTVVHAMELISDLMQKIGVKKSDFDLKNPSGLTNENRMSAYALWQVLNYEKNHFQVQPEFATSLPIAGVDGTLKKRFKDQNYERKVRAKTGSINGVVSLAGYVAGPSGEMIPFAMMYNGTDDENAVRALFDDICKVIIAKD